MLHQAVTCLNCLLRWYVVEKAIFYPDQDLADHQEDLKVTDRTQPMAGNQWLHLSGERHLWSQNRTKHQEDCSPLHGSLTSLRGVCVKRTVLLKREVLFREGKPLVAFDGSRTKRSFSIARSLFPPASLHNLCGTPPMVMYSVWGRLDSYKGGTAALLQS